MTVNIKSVICTSCNQPHSLIDGICELCRHRQPVADMEFPRAAIAILAVGLLVVIGGLVLASTLSGR